MSKLSVIVDETAVAISQGNPHTMRIPLAFLPEFIEVLRTYGKDAENPDNIVYFHETNGVAFGPRSCKLILFNKGSTPHLVASFKPSTVSTLIEGLLPHVEDCYLTRDLLALKHK